MYGRSYSIIKKCTESEIYSGETETKNIKQNETLNDYKPTQMKMIMKKEKIKGTLTRDLFENEHCTIEELGDVRKQRSLIEAPCALGWHRSQQVH